ncbi:MAG: hypothetical protein V1791_15305 [Pseudomonadota bacterium]
MRITDINEVLQYGIDFHGHFCSSDRYELTTKRWRVASPGGFVTVQIK